MTNTNTTPLKEPIYKYKKKKNICHIKGCYTDIHTQCEYCSTNICKYTGSD